MKNLLFVLFNIVFVFPVLITCHPNSKSKSDDDDSDDDDDKGKGMIDVGALFNSNGTLGMALGPQLSGALAAFLGQTGNPTVQNELKSALKVEGNGTAGATTACPAMSVIFARGTAEPGTRCFYFFMFTASILQNGKCADMTDMHLRQCWYPDRTPLLRSSRRLHERHWASRHPRR
jgi:hypothetical protein